MNTIEVLEGIRDWTNERIGTCQPAMTVVSQTEASVTIQPNVLNVWSTPIASLTVRFARVSGITNEYLIQFTCPSDGGTKLLLPSGVTWLNDNEPDPEPGYTYQISILNGLAVYGEWEV